MKYTSVQDVVQWRLCMGCGACFGVCKQAAITLKNFYKIGIRPVIDQQKCQRCGDCIKVCPGIELTHQFGHSESYKKSLRCSWGPILESWEGYAADPEIRYMGSSGGVVTALSLFAVERYHYRGVLHIAADTENPSLNQAVISTDRASLMRGAGSRYSPAAPCGRFNEYRDNHSLLFVGKPCDVAAFRKMQTLNGTAETDMPLCISIFCAGTPSCEGTGRIFETLGVSASQVSSLRYRGGGWPGLTQVCLKESDSKILSMTYEKSWGHILTQYVQLRCRLCPDGTGEFADISCGDPWYKPVEPDDPGHSMVLVRTEAGRRFLEKAIEAGYLYMKPLEDTNVELSQPGLLGKRCNLWGRLLAMKLLGIPVPRYQGFSLFANWKTMSFVDQMKSILGTLRRAVVRKWLRPMQLPENDEQ